MKSFILVTAIIFCTASCNNSGSDPNSTSVSPGTSGNSQGSSDRMNSGTHLESRIPAATDSAGSGSGNVGNGSAPATGQGIRGSASGRNDSASK